MKIGFIGLGVMGSPMAQNLQRSGRHQLSVFDLDPRRCDELERLGARRAASIADAIEAAEVVMTSLPGPRQIEAVGLGDDGLLARMQPARYGSISAPTICRWPRRSARLRRRPASMSSMHRYRGATRARAPAT